jgi:dihydrodipicolinate synthase/N-acetylneuraminate lyase
MPTFALKGVICAMITPMDEDGDVDLVATAELVRFLSERHMDGVFIGGTTGEGPLLSLDERKRLVDCAVEAAQEQIVTIFHTGCQNTRDAVKLTRYAVAAGADATTAITPYFYTLADEEITAHYLALAEAEPEAPLLLYCFPGNAKNDITPEVFARLRAQAPNVVGIKYSGDNFVRIQDYIMAGGPTCYVYAGDDRLLLAALRAGGSGPVSGCAGIFPELYRNLYDAFVAGRSEEAERYQELVRRLAAAVSYGQIALIKAALEMRGLHKGPVRAPLGQPSPTDLQRLQDQLAELDLLGEVQQ